jgi:predicted thioesterase
MMEIGQTAEATLVVKRSDTAEAVAIESDEAFPAVLATSRMIALMELAAARLMKPLLQDGQLSVGVTVSIKHTAATPVDSQVRAVATFAGEDGKLFRFRVEAFDEAGAIGEGEHTRAIVNTERLLASAAKRRSSRS